MRPQTTIFISLQPVALAHLAKVGAFEAKHGSLTLKTMR